MEFDLECRPVDQRGRTMYSERPIHGGIYEARPDVNAVVHNHAYEVIPFSVTKVKLRPLLHVAARIGGDIPVWDIRENFGDTNLLVTTMAMGRDLARCLGPRSVSLMRGHGCAVAGPNLYAAVQTSVYLMVNARLQADALKLGGEVTYLSPGEIDEMTRADAGSTRAWEYWSRRCGADRL